MTTGQLTAKGRATRDRIVVTAANLILTRGVGGTSLDDIGRLANTGRSQLFHYFPDGKLELVAAIVSLQSDRVLNAQRPHIDDLDTWESWNAWRAAVIDHYASQSHLACPISALANELIGHEPAHAAKVAAFMLDWQHRLEVGVERMIANGHLQPTTNAHDIGEMIFAALQGGLVLMNMRRTLEPLMAGLDAGLAVLQRAALERRPHQTERRRRPTRD